jgi:hypothetical protein
MLECPTRKGKLVGIFESDRRYDDPVVTHGAGYCYCTIENDYVIPARLPSSLRCGS